MSSSRARVLRSVVLGSVIAATAAVGAAAPAGAQPGEPAFTSHTFRTDLLSGAPFPVGYQIVDAATNGTGIVRFETGPLCNSLAPGCTEFNAPLSVRWVNFSTGASGAARVGDTPVFDTTGRGSVGIAIYGAYNAALPSFGIINP